MPFAVTQRHSTFLAIGCCVATSGGIKRRVARIKWKWFPVGNKTFREAIRFLCGTQKTLKDSSISPTVRSPWSSWEAAWRNGFQTSTETPDVDGAVEGLEQQRTLRGGSGARRYSNEAKSDCCRSVSWKLKVFALCFQMLVSQWVKCLGGYKEMQSSVIVRKSKLGRL